MTEVVEAGEVSAEIRSLLHAAYRTDSVLKVGIHLYLLTKPDKTYIIWSKQEFFPYLGVLISMNAAATAFM